MKKVAAYIEEAKGILGYQDVTPEVIEVAKMLQIEGQLELAKSFHDNEGKN